MKQVLAFALGVFLGGPMVKFTTHLFYWAIITALVVFWSMSHVAHADSLEVLTVHLGKNF